MASNYQKISATDPEEGDTSGTDDGKASREKSGTGVFEKVGGSFAIDPKRQGQKHSFKRQRTPKSFLERPSTRCIGLVLAITLLLAVVTHIKTAWGRVAFDYAASASKICNEYMALPDAPYPRVLEVAGPWEHRCLNENHPGHWEGPKGFWSAKQRNWCWVYMKQIVNEDRHQMNWWHAQKEAAAAGLAPDPANDQIMPLLRPDLCDVPENGASLNVGNDERELATRWFNEHISVFVLNLPEDTKRMEMISGRLKELNITYQRVDGISLSDNASIKWAKSAGYIAPHWDVDKVRAAEAALYASDNGVDIDYVVESDLGNIGCTAAHLNAMRIAAASATASGRPLVLILEDDAHLLDDIAVKVKHLVENDAPCDWQAISLKCYSPYGKCVTSQLARIYPDGNEPAERCRKGASWNFAALLYKVSSLDQLRARLAEVVWDTSTPACIPQDTALASISNEIAYYAVPASLYPGFVDVIKVENWHVQRTVD